MSSKTHFFALEVFPSFRPLLEECEDYARTSGGRFIPQDFESKLVGNNEALRRAFPVVEHFANQCLDDAQVKLEFEQAFRLSVAVGVRNAVRATCVQLGLWKPAASGQFGWQEEGIPLQEVAGRMYNFYQTINEEDQHTEHVRALTASFISDFGSSMGLGKVPCPEQEMIMGDFIQKVATYGKTAGVDTEPALQKVLDPTHTGVLRLFSPHKLNEWHEWTKQNQATLVVGAIAAVGMALAVGAFVIKGLSSAKR